MPKIPQSEIRKKDYYVVRDIKNDDVKNVIFPNGLQVGFDEFRESAKSNFYNDVTVSGSILLNPDLDGGRGFIQFIPGNASGSIDTYVSASYIYASGSTNDIHFTQVDGPYTNTTRLRWLESTVCTGLLHGGRLSTQNGTTTFSIEAGHGLYVDYNSSYTDEPKPVIKDVMWEPVISQSLTYVASYQITYIAMDTNGQVVQSINPYSDGDFDNKIVLGRILHQNGSVTNGAVTAPVVSYARTQHILPFIKAFGPLKISGHTLSSPSSNLGVVRAAGESYVIGRNYTVNSDSPDYVTSTTDIAMVTPKIFREYWTGGTTTLVIDTNAGSGYTVIDPTQYNPGGAGLSGVSAASKFTIQRVYWFPNSVNKALHIYYGVAEYNSITDAEAAVNTEAFTESTYTSAEAIYVGYIIVKRSCTDLNNAADAKITMVGLSRVTTGGGGGGGGGGGAGAPTSATYVTLTTDATLTNERTLTAGAGLTLTDAGAGSTVTLDVGAGTDITVNANDIQVNRSTLATAFAGNGLSDAGSSLAVNPGNGIKIVTDAVSIDNSVVATVSGTTFTGDVYFTNLFVSGSTRLGDASSDSLQVTANSWFDNNINVSGSVVIRQDLTVNGTTTTVNTTNLTVKDPLIYFGSGSVGTNNNGGIALASGSSTTNQALVWGRVANDTWGAGKQDVAAGTSTDVTGMTLSPVRASKFEIGGTRAYVSSSNSQTLELAANTQVLILSGGASSSADPRSMTDVNMFVSGSTKSLGTSVQGTSGFGGDLLVSGAMRSLEIDASMVIAFQMFS